MAGQRSVALFDRASGERDRRSEDTIARLADDFAQTQPGLAIGGGAAGNHTNGVDILIAVNALNHLVGNLGAPGGLVFNPPPVAGGSASTAGRAIARCSSSAQDARSGRIDVLIVNKTNPVFTLPAAAGFKEALAHIPTDRQPVELHG